MISWLIIALLCLMAFFIMKLSHIRHRYSLVVIIVLLLLLYLSAIYVNRSSGFDLSTTEGFVKALRVYTGWLANGFQNVKTISGNAIKMDWTATNDTIINKTIEKVKDI